MGLVGYTSAANSERLAQEARLEARMMAHGRDMLEAFLLERIGTRDVLMGRDNESTHLLERGEAELRKATDNLVPLLATDELRDLYAKVDLASTAYTRRNQEVVALYRSGDQKEALALFKAPAALEAVTAMTGALNDLIQQIELDRHNILQQQVASNAWTKRLMLILALAGLVAGLGIAHLTAYSIVQAIRAMLAMVNAVSSNDLMVGNMEVRSDDEIGKAAEGLNRMKNNLREVILSIASTAEEVSTSSREISATALQAASSADNQKQQVQQVATTMLEMEATVREVSHHSNAAARSAGSAANNARDGGRIVEDVQERMRGIAQSVGESAANIEQLGAQSDEIGRIVGVIDEIANQTNLLALNAAIEAARAGEQGRGFAVVAGEVRRLAERTTAATREIAVVIESVQKVTADAVRQMRSGTAAVQQGVEVTGFAGESIQRIIREADNVGVMVAQIASAATQQATATEEVTVSMSQISQLVGESADGSQLSARACGQLLSLALGLQNMVGRFDVGQHEAEGDEQVEAALPWEQGESAAVGGIG
jgi:methyl-accepting chemotaxis protein